MVKIVCKIINLSLPNLACFAPWRESIPALEYFTLPENLREARKLLNIVVHAFPQTALGKRGSPVGEQPQRKLGMSPAKTPRPQRSEKNGENHLREYFSFPSELGAFAPWREEFPNPRTLDFRNI